MLILLHKPKWNTLLWDGEQLVCVCVCVCVCVWRQRAVVAPSAEEWQIYLYDLNAACGQQSHKEPHEWRIYTQPSTQSIVLLLYVVMAAYQHRRNLQETYWYNLRLEYKLQRGKAPQNTAKAPRPPPPHLFVKK